MPLSLHPHNLPHLAAVHAVLAALVAWVVWTRVRAGALSWREVGAWIVAALGWGILSTQVLGPALPVAAFSPLREGFTLSHLRLLTGIGTDTGPVRDVFWLPVLTGARTLRAIVTVDLAFAGWTALLLAGWARALRIPPLLSTVLVGVSVLGAAGLTAATTEVGASVAGTYALGAGALYALAVRRDLPWSTRLPAGLGAVLTGALLVLVRAELLALVAAGLVGLLLAWAWPAGRAALEDRASRAVTWLAARPWWPALAVVAWVALSLGVYDGAGSLRSLGSWGWLVRGLHPLHVHGLTLALVLPAVLAPALVQLALRGAVRALAAPVTSAALPVVVWVLYVTMRLAAHGGDTLGEARTVAPWELYRYVLVLAPLVALLALRGAQDDDRPWLWAMMLVLVPPLPEASLLLALHPGPLADWPVWFGVQGDAPTEVRALVARTEAAPACGVLTLGAPWLPDRGDPVPRLTWAALRPGPLGWEVHTADLAPTVEAVEAAEVLLAGVPCALAWRSLDCGALAASEAGARPHPSLPGCAPLDALDPVETWTINSRPFVHPQHTLAWADTLELGWFRVPGWPADP